MIPWDKLNIQNISENTKSIDIKAGDHPIVPIASGDAGTVNLRQLGRRFM
jgi:hypothetical protein